MAAAGDIASGWSHSHDCPTTASQRRIATHRTARPSAHIRGGPAMSFHCATATLGLPPSASVPRPRHGPAARSRNIPMPADEGDQRRVIADADDHRRAGLAKHRLNVRSARNLQPHPNDVVSTFKPFYRQDQCCSPVAAMGTVASSSSYTDPCSPTETSQLWPPLH